MVAVPGRSQLAGWLVSGRRGEFYRTLAELPRVCEGPVLGIHGGSKMATEAISPVKSVFVSYAHEDRHWADTLVRFLSPVTREERISLWDDSQIEPGDRWHAAIADALSRANVSVLLVTQHFLASDYIMNVELPGVLARAERGETRIFWIAVSASTYRDTALVNYQAANDPSAPIDSLSQAEQNETWVQIARDISVADGVGAVARSFSIVDETSEAIEAILEGRPEDPERGYGVVARYHPATDTVSFDEIGDTITYEDLINLPAEDREFIQDHEDSLARHYADYRTTKNQLGVVGGIRDDETENEMRRILRLMCADLNHILDFLVRIHKVSLEDHYGRYRYLCTRI